MIFQTLRPEFWADDREVPDMPLDGTVGGPIVWLLRTLNGKGPWDNSRRTLTSRQMRRFAQLFTSVGSIEHRLLIDAAYHLLHHPSHSYALSIAVTAAMYYQTIACPPKGSQDILVQAAKEGNLDMARTAYGAVIDRSDFNGVTPLMLAAQAAHHDMVSWLLAMGANPNAQDVFGENYTHYQLIAMASRKRCSTRETLPKPKDRGTYTLALC